MPKMRKFRLLCSQLIFLAAFCGLLSPSRQVPPRGGVIYLDYHGRDGRLATASYLVTRDGFFRMFGGTYQAATEQERIAITNDGDTDTDGDGYAGDVKLLVMLERMSCEAETRADSHLWLEDGRGRGRQVFCNNLVGGKVTISEGDTGVAVGVSEGWGGGSGVDATGKANLATLRVAAYYKPKSHVCSCSSCSDFCCKPCGGVGTGYCMSKEAMPEWRSGLSCPCGLHDGFNSLCDARQPPISESASVTGPRIGSAGVGPRETSYLMYWVVGLSVLGVALLTGVWQHQKRTAVTRSGKQHTADDGYGHQNSHSYGLNMEPQPGLSLRARGQDKYDS